ncbi:uncharacterized protein LOC129766509 [Toxorhynchites rutilus septentrionalis]|uniref:uncharacterized protein LOC129766509 n=1 Tax=Toxorhynchites rutilus septentrionalis TaxID=329112 RepID=UPI0024786D3C|nr:uncharacterized protein LOC129766509 [Toxorhynchites rutilus septentrionalis]
MDNVSCNIGTININTITNQNKINALRTFVRSMELDIVFLQEVENEQLVLPGYNVICNVDHTRRGTAIALKEYIKFTHVEKSLDGRLVALRVHNVTLCNVYAPSGSVPSYYLRHHSDHIILGGDFNCVIRQCDATGQNSSPALQATVQQLRLFDVWQQLRPREMEYTYITHNSSSRLDRHYVSNGLREQLRSTTVHLLRHAYDGYQNNRAMLTTINRIKAKMLTHQRAFSEMFVRINETLVAGEPLSTYQLGERVRRKTTIERLRNERDEVMDDSTAIQNYMVEYFTNLYTAGHVEENSAFQCERIIPEQDDVNGACMNDITTAEILTAIRTSASRKLPGSDGLPKEFYLRTLMSNFPPQFVDGVIVLVKKRGTGDSARSYRPISLINYDYKILSRVLKQRLENVLRVLGVLTGFHKCSTLNAIYSKQL